MEKNNYFEEEEVLDLGIKDIKEAKKEEKIEKQEKNNKTIIQASKIASFWDRAIELDEDINIDDLKLYVSKKKLNKWVRCSFPTGDYAPLGIDEEYIQAYHGDGKYSIELRYKGKFLGHQVIIIGNEEEEKTPQNNQEIEILKNRIEAIEETNRELKLYLTEMLNEIKKQKEEESKKLERYELEKKLEAIEKKIEEKSKDNILSSVLELIEKLGLNKKGSEIDDKILASVISALANLKTEEIKTQSELIKEKMRTEKELKLAKLQAEAEVERELNTDFFEEEPVIEEKPKHNPLEELFFNFLNSLGAKLDIAGFTLIRKDELDNMLKEAQRMGAESAVEMLKAKITEAKAKKYEAEKIKEDLEKLDKNENKA